MTRREWHASALLGAKTLLLLSCGGEDESEQEPREEPGSRVGTGVDAAKESQEFTLAVLDHPLMVTPDQKAIQEWTNVNKPVACATGLVFIPLIVGPITPPHLLQATGDESFFA